jgi:hypothetical protein
MLYPLHKLSFYVSKKRELRIVAHACNHSSLEAEAGVLLWLAWATW